MSTEHTSRPPATTPVTTTEARTMQATMQATVQDRYGEARDVLRSSETIRPEIGADEVLLRVHAAGVDRGVWHLMTGRPYLLRLFGYGLRAPTDRVRGREVAGQIEAVGANVTTLRPGDDVFGIAEGSFAEYARARADKLAPKPAGLTINRPPPSRSRPSPPCRPSATSREVQPGQHVLVIGASGGVGTFAVQIAKAYGAEVTGVCSTAKIDLVRSLGAEHVIDYTRDDHHRRPPPLRRDPRHRRAPLADATCGAPSPPAGHSSSSDPRPVGDGSVASTARCGRPCCPCSSARRSARSPTPRTPTTCTPSPSSSSPAPWHRPSTGPTHSAETPAAVQYMTDGHAHGKVVITVREQDD